MLCGLAVISLCLAQTPNSAPSAPDEQLGPAVEDALRRATNEYAYGQYEQAAERLSGLLYPMRLNSDAQVIEARKTLALAHYMLGREQAMREEFAKLLYLDPDHELDPFTIAPPVIEILEQVRQSLKAELDVIRERRRQERLAVPPKGGNQRTIQIVTRERSSLGTFMPFGIGQFQNGDRKWGTFFAATQAALLGLNIGAFVWNLRLGNFEKKDATLHRALILTQFSTAALFGVSWAVSIFHARLNFVPVVQEPQKVVDTPVKTRNSGRNPIPLQGGMLTIDLNF